MSRARVVVVDDSAFARTVLSRLLRAGGVDVIATARNGVEALERITAMQPDVITLDLTMPELDGIGVLRALAGRTRPRVIVVSISNIDTELGAEALALGAVDLVAKPSALADDRLHQIGTELVAKVTAAAVQEPAAPAEELAPLATAEAAADLVVIGMSTGGPQALTRLASELRGDLAPVAVALHIPAGYTQSLAQRLDKHSKLDVVEAVPGLVLRKGMLVLAPGGAHLRIVRNSAGELVAEIGALPIMPFRPSVDELFRSATAAAGKRVLGVILTGMGDDGLAGSREIARNGGMLLAEAASTCVVYGMPRAVHEANLGAAVVPLDRVALEIAHRARVDR